MAFYKYSPFGLEQGGSHRNGGSSSDRYKYNGKELDETIGWYDYGARFYDPTIGRWGQVDPLADIYPKLSSYTYVANTPINAIDPDGKLLIFINGFDGFDNSNEANKKYWGRFAEGVEQHFGEDPNRSMFFHGGVSPSPGIRKLLGFFEGINKADEILDQIVDENGFVTESIKVITHSMGAAYGIGFVLALLKRAEQRGVKGVPITLVADFDPFQAASMGAIENVYTQQYSHVRGDGKDDNALRGDWSGLANKKQRNAEFYTTDPKNASHNIYTFIADISKLKEGTYTWNGTNWILEGDSKGDKK